MDLKDIAAFIYRTRGPLGLADFLRKEQARKNKSVQDEARSKYAKEMRHNPMARFGIWNPSFNGSWFRDDYGNEITLDGIRKTVTLSAGISLKAETVHFEEIVNE